MNIAMKFTIILDIFETGRHLAHHERRRDIRAIDLIMD